MATATTTTRAPRRERARIEWQEVKPGKSWSAAFAEPARTRDETYVYRDYDGLRLPTRPAYMECTIRALIYPNDPRQRTCYILMTRGARKGGTRRRDFWTLDEAQQAGEKWARQRFFVLPVGTA